jgi:hypothetical protein
MAIRNYSCIFSPTYDHHRVNANLKWHGTVAGQQQYYRVAASGIRNKLLHYTQCVMTALLHLITVLLHIMCK